MRFFESSVLPQAMLFLSLLFLTITPVIAANDPGHDSLYIERAGDNVSGTFNFSGTFYVPSPGSAMEAATRQYVDDTVNAANDSIWNQSGSDIYYDGGKVGIGTTTPNGTLTVRDQAENAFVVENGTGANLIEADTVNNTFVIRGPNETASKNELRISLKETETVSSKDQLIESTKDTIRIKRGESGYFEFMEESDSLLQIYDPAIRFRNVDRLGRADGGLRTIQADTKNESEVLDIWDKDGDELLTFSSAANALNYLDIKNAPNNTAPVLSTTGDSTNVDLNISMKGNGSLSVLGDLNVTSGNDVCIDGGNCLSSVGGGNISGSGFADQIAFWNGNTSLTGESNLYWDSSNDELGIGTSSPNGSLEVGSGQILIPEGSSSTPGLAFGNITDSGIYTNPSFEGVYFTAQGNKQFIITNRDATFESLVGMGGESDPEADLAVKGNAVIGSAYSNTDTGPTDGLLVQGDVGINTTSPGVRLDVNGSINATTDVCIDGGNCLSSVGGGNISGSGFADQIAFWNGNTSLTGESNLYWDSSNDRLGIKTSSPSAALDVTDNVGDGNYVTRIESSGSNGEFVNMINHHGNTILAIKQDNNAEPVLDIITDNGNTRFSVGSDIIMNPNTGIGTSTPETQLEVNGTGRFKGNVNVTSSNDICIEDGNCLSSVGSGGTLWTNDSGTAKYDGNVNVTGNINYGGNLTSYSADVAENFYGSNKVVPGEVVVADPAGEERVMRSNESYDTGVLGIVSTDPAMILGEGKGSVPVALSGRVPVKATTENGDINPGDLLTTSNSSGKVMKCKDRRNCFGALVGKAVTSLEKDQGNVTAVVTLG